MLTTVYIGLGSNLEEPLAQVSTALVELGELPNSRLVSHSSLYSSQPQGPADQPDFINAVACLETQLEPHALLDALQALEQSHQRVRIQHWGPRTLDLDLLLYGAQTIDTERLSVPHPWLGKRSFVLHPLAEIAPDLTLPSGESIESLLPLCDAGDLNVITAS